MSYNDKDYMDASKIAYTNFDNAIESLGGGKHSIRELIKEKYKLEDTSLETIRKYAQSCENADDKSRLLSYCENEKVLDWKLVVSDNQNSASGFCASIIETEEGKAMIACRGSEALGKYENDRGDWVDTDFNLLVQEDSNQQQLAAELFIKENKDLLMQYDNIDVTGHSLGGELATHVIVTCANEHREIFDKIERCVNLDGPGHNQEYYSQYDYDMLREVGAKTTYYEWSGVSGCLSPIPGATVIHAKIKDIKDVNPNANILEDIGYMLLARHHLDSPELKDGNIVVASTNGKIKINEHDGITEIGEADTVSKMIEGLTNTLDKNNMLSICLWATLSWCTHNLLEEGEDGKTYLSSYGLGLVIATMALVLAFPEVAVVTLEIILFLIIGAAGIYLWEKYLKETITCVIEQLKKMYVDFKEHLEEIESKLLNWCSSVKEKFKNTFNIGYSYATDNPYIKVNTDLLREYASQLNYINNRIVNIDAKLKGLYPRVGLTDMLRLIQADILVGYNFRLTKCKNYLNDTADNFDKAENNIISVFN